MLTSASLRTVRRWDRCQQSFWAVNLQRWYIWFGDSWSWGLRMNLKKHLIDTTHSYRVNSQVTSWFLMVVVWAKLLKLKLKILVLCSFVVWQRCDSRVDTSTEGLAQRMMSMTWACAFMLYLRDFTTLSPEHFVLNYTPVRHLPQMIHNS